MRQKLLLTLAIGEAFQQLSRLTHPSLRAYASRIGAEFLSIEKQTISHTSPHWEKFRIYDFLKYYDRILYMDTDLIIRDDCPNLFDLVPDGVLGMFNEAPFTVRSKELMIDICRAYGVTLPWWSGQYYNSGVMVVSQAQRELFRPPVQEVCNFYEQSYLNMQIAALDVPVYELPYQYNRMTCVDQWTGEHRLASYIVHYAGAPRFELLPPLITADLQAWGQRRPAYQFTRHIHVLVSGGLGDQMNAEPAIRFMHEQVYPEAQIVISTHWPRLFVHLGLPVYQMGTFTPEPDTPYYTVNSLPGPDSTNWAVLSNLLCHTVDYCSSALLRRRLPVEAKRPQVLSTPVDLIRLEHLAGTVELDKVVLVHAGRHWQTKTFPLAWWQAVVDGIAAAGLSVCLIGQNADEPADKRGIVQVVCPPGGLDLRQQLSLGELIAILQVAPVLISNDSAPVHLAGAFDNWIVLIPSCKHPEHVLPYRHGSTDWRTRALYKRLTIDDVSSQPTDIHGVSVDFDVQDWSVYLPDPGAVVAQARSVYA